jgi:hypothetical protein
MDTNFQVHKVLTVISPGMSSLKLLHNLSMDSPFF